MANGFVFPQRKTAIALDACKSSPVLESTFGGR